MTTLKISFRSAAFAASSFAVSLFAFAGIAAAQIDAPHPWRNADDQAQSAPASQDNPAISSSEQGPADAQQAPPQGQLPAPPFGAPNQQQPGFGQQPPYGPDPNAGVAVPPRLTLPAGTYVTVRMNQWLSSDRNQQGDTFFATLTEPIIVDGIVVAQRGQNVSGRVTEAVKAGMAKGVSHLGLQLTELTLVDGQQISIQSQVANRQGPTSVGRDVGAVGGTTALGAALGAIAGRGTGAAIGAGAGAGAGLIGVLLTRGQPTVVAPEQQLTFRIEAPVTIATDRAPQAFRPVEPPDYQRTTGPVGPRPGYGVAPGPYPYPAYPYYGPAYYPYPYYGYGYAPGFGVFVGPGYYGYRGYYFRR